MSVLNALFQWGLVFKLSTKRSVLGLESPVGSKGTTPVENGSLCVTQFKVCGELGARSGRQGAAGVQPEHLAVLGLQSKHPTRMGVKTVRVFVWDALQAKVQSEKLMVPAERSELIYLTVALVDCL
jgi:hypothetical protein